jgi:hypothetical protein
VKDFVIREREEIVRGRKSFLHGCLCARLLKILSISLSSLTPRAARMESTWTGSLPIYSIKKIFRKSNFQRRYDARLQVRNFPNG